MCFKVTVDNAHPLGEFISCEGLGCEITIEQREVGGNNDFVYQLPVRIKFTNVKLTRPLNADSRNVAAWFASMSGNVSRSTVQIVALKADGSEVTQWNLKDVIPVRWQGPSFSAESNKVATETLELAHHGFLKA